MEAIGEVSEEDSGIQSQDEDSQSDEDDLEREIINDLQVKQMPSSLLDLT
jgi:hypothetical protein